MAVPKGKTSKARKNSRRAANWKLTLPGIAKCPRCSAMKRNHYVCKNCGYYDGRQEILVNADAKK